MMELTMTLLLLCFAGGMAYFLHWNNKSIVVTKYIYENRNVPEAFDGYRITQVSDLQSEYFGKNQERLLEKVAETHPEIIVLTGDLVDRNHTDYQAAECAIKGLLEMAPVFYVNGNHEMALKEEEINGFYELMETLGVHILWDNHYKIKRNDDTICLAGLSEYTVFRCKDFQRSNKIKADPHMLSEALHDIRQQYPPDGFTILLSHEPQYFDLYETAGFDLIFSGHAHGGQIRLPLTDGLYAPGQGVMPKMTSGIRKRDTAALVISRGLGNSTFPFRVFNRPEVVLVELKRTGRN